MTFLCLHSTSLLITNHLASTNGAYEHSAVGRQIILRMVFGQQVHVATYLDSHVLEAQTPTKKTDQIQQRNKLALL